MADVVIIHMLKRVNNNDACWDSAIVGRRILLCSVYSG
jgi:hypothetical protein